MARRNWATSLGGLWVLAALSGCQGGVVFFDAFEEIEGTRYNAPESLHRYATDARVRMWARTDGYGPDVSQLALRASGAVSLDPEEEIERDSSNLLEFVLRTADSGTGVVTLHDDAGEEVARRELEVVEADELAVAVTAPALAGIALPSLDPERIRIYAGGEPSVRVTLRQGGEEIFGTEAVEGTPAQPALNVRRATCCAATSCDAERSAVKIGVPSTLSEDVEVELTAGQASLVLTVAPTSDVEITDLTLDEGAPDAPGEQSGLVAAVLAGDERVLGAPVSWRLAGAELSGTGDLLRFEITSGATVAAQAELDGRTASIGVRADVDTTSVDSITGSCASVDPSLGAVLLAALLGRRAWRARRRREVNRSGAR